MRILFLLTLLCFLTPPSLAMAQDAASPLTRGALPDGRVKSLPEPTTPEIQEANAVGRSCAIGNEKNYFDCDCVALNYLQQRMMNKSLNKQDDVFMMKTNAKKACPNSVAVAGRGYRSCMGWAPRMRTDYQAFCDCYGNAYAEAFAKTPAITIQENKAVMSSALKTCNVGAPVTARINRNARVKEMEQSGAYDEMFPGGADRRKPIGPQPGDPVPAPLTPWQKMQGTLLDKDTRRDRPE